MASPNPRTKAGSDTKNRGETKTTKTEVLPAAIGLGSAVYVNTVSWKKPIPPTGTKK